MRGHPSRLRLAGLSLRRHMTELLIHLAVGVGLVILVLSMTLGMVILMLMGHDRENP